MGPCSEAQAAEKLHSLKFLKKAGFEVQRLETTRVYPSAARKRCIHLCESIKKVSKSRIRDSELGNDKSLFKSKINNDFESDRCRVLGGHCCRACLALDLGQTQ
jgi:hypothetical protein